MSGMTTKYVENMDSQRKKWVMKHPVWYTIEQRAADYEIIAI
jgi:hypothetical protein